MPQRQQEKSGNFIKRLQKRLNSFQQRHTFTAFTYAVIKKFGDDEAGHEGALITYYGFLSLFPLLIIATSVIDLISQHNPALRDRLVASINNYLPVVGDQLQRSVHGARGTGLALIFGLLITLYGARGGAAAIQHALNHIWQVPKTVREGFPKSTLKSLIIIFIGGGGLLIAAFLSGLATSLNHSAWFKVVPTLISITILFGVFLVVFNIGTDDKKIGYKAAAPGALITAVGLQVLQTIGSYYVTHQLRNLTSLYGTFALVLGVLAWIYLQAQIMIYGIEASTVHAYKLWPRSLLPEFPAKADEAYIRKEEFVTSHQNSEPAKHN